jgi:hypothetical protein
MDALVDTLNHTNVRQSQAHLSANSFSINQNISAFSFVIECGFKMMGDFTYNERDISFLLHAIIAALRKITSSSTKLNEAGISVSHHTVMRHMAK